MKCVKNIQTNEVRKVTDAIAQSLNPQLFVFIKKEEYKRLTRPENYIKPEPTPSQKRKPVTYR